MSLSNWTMDNLAWLIAGSIVVAGLLIYGLGDLLRFSLRRAWAISSVCFDESIRGKVWLITPLAIFGVVIVSQLQKSVDEQDAIRQTMKFCLFASGLVVTMAAVILACTSLPKDIESRVIYTVVTKPTTRLEIVMGKVIGFAKVSAVILCIMGLFTWAYLRGFAWYLRRGIEQRLEARVIEPSSRDTYEYWRRNGLLSSCTFETPENLEVFSRQPAAGDRLRWFFGDGEGEMLMKFSLTPQDLVPGGVADARAGQGGLAVNLHLGFARSKYGALNTSSMSAHMLPYYVEAPRAAAPEGDADTPKSADVAVEILAADMSTVISAAQFSGGPSFTLTDPTGETPIFMVIDSNVCQNLLGQSEIYVSVIGTSPGVEYSADISCPSDPRQNPVFLFVPGTTQELSRVIGPEDVSTDPQYKPAPPIFRARGGLFGQQIRGGEPAKSPVAVYRFQGARPAGSGDRVSFEMRVGIERSGEEASESEDTRVELTFVDRQTGQLTATQIVRPENRRTAYFDAPAAPVRSGNFDVYLRNLTTGHFVGLKNVSLSLVVSREFFDFNLVKSLLILWLFSILADRHGTDAADFAWALGCGAARRFAVSRNRQPGGYGHLRRQFRQQRQLGAGCEQRGRQDVEGRQRSRRGSPRHPAVLRH
jgi:hypothetical protein